MLTEEEKLLLRYNGGARQRCFDAYLEQYPKDEIVYNESIGGKMTVSNQNYLDGVSENYDETEEGFMDRLKRSREVGENLFYKEWKHFESSYKDDLMARLIEYERVTGSPIKPR